MVRKDAHDGSSLVWIHRIREQHYRKTKDLSVERWMKPIDSEKAVEACRRLGLRVRLGAPRRVRHTDPAVR